MAPSLSKSSLNSRMKPKEIRDEPHLPPGVQALDKKNE